VATTLRHLGHEVSEVDVDERLTHEMEAADVVFVAVHGRDGEDGTIQLIAEAYGIPYTGSAPLACHLCFDKGLAKSILREDGIPVPPGYVLSAETIRRMGAGTALRRAAERLTYPIVVKPASQGSALGFVSVEAPEELSSAVMTAFNYGDRVVLERFVQGPELAVAVQGPDLDTLPPVEIRTESGVFDFHARVTPGARDYICPAKLDDEVVEASREIARQTCTRLGLRDFGRVDIRVGSDGPVVLDVKTCPGLTETSLVPLAANEAGVGFERLVGDVLEAALARSR
jgi:D-alanine-D-alanine ligase